ncbi:uncharacterized protein LOC134680712 isoform X1 [Mytilus trossulus]|uniref:uncharacterized protein LOC134680712 isoform X1 n=1 Tax=Mytilus trossulus TaxID=6551 RepID=UPI0030040FB9
MSNINQEIRAVLPRRVKKSFDYRVFDQLGMQSEAVTTEPEVGDELVHGATGGSDSMSKVDYEDLKERLSIYLDSDESDTDEETKELVRKLKEVKQKEKAMKNKKRKVELRQEIEKRMKELEELEELELKGASKPKKEKSGKKVDQSKKIKGKNKETDKEKGKETDKGKDKDKGKGKGAVKDSKEPGTFLIVSDSIAKYVKLENADVFAFRGASIGEITYQLNKNKGSIYEGYKCLIIHCGTNDIHILSIDQFKSAYCNLISTAKLLFPSMVIAMSGILPRPVDFEETGQKIKAVNMALLNLCLSYNVEFIHSYRYFLKCGKPKVELFAYKDGGLHLNCEGTRQLGVYFKRRVAHLI